MAYKSDVEVKQKFIEKLLNEGFDTAEVKAKPADVVAQKGGVTWCTSTSAWMVSANVSRLVLPFP